MLTGGLTNIIVYIYSRLRSIGSAFHKIYGTELESVS